MQELFNQFQKSYPAAGSLQSASQFLSLSEVRQILQGFKGSPLTNDEEDELYPLLKEHYKVEQLGEVRQYLIA
jgi:hypothetical protein